VDENRLESVPPELVSLHNLEILWLNHNRLEAFPPELCRLQALKMLGLEDNQLPEIPCDVSQMQRLQKLYVSGNRFTAIPAELAELPQIRSLDFRHNQLRSLPEELRQSQSLREIFLHGNDALGLPELILGPTPEECRESKLPATDPESLFAWYFTEDEEEKGRICLEIAARAAEMTQTRMAEEETRRKQREEAQRSLDEGIRGKEREKEKEKQEAREAPKSSLKLKTPDGAGEAPAAAESPAAGGEEPEPPEIPTAATSQQGNGGTHADPGSSTHFLERQHREHNKPAPASSEPRVTHNINIDRPKRKAMPERLSEKEKQSGRGDGWGKKLLGGLLGKKGKDDDEDVIK
jgi:hypothetical protein